MTSPLDITTPSSEFTRGLNLISKMGQYRSGERQRTVAEAEKERQRFREALKKQASNQLGADILSGAGTAFGFLAGGPPGAAIGQGLSGVAGSLAFGQAPSGIARGLESAGVAAGQLYRTSEALREAAREAFDEDMKEINKFMGKDYRRPEPSFGAGGRFMGYR